MDTNTQDIADIIDRKPVERSESSPQETQTAPDTPSETVASTSEQPRGPDGKFAPKQSAQPAPVVSEPTGAKPLEPTPPVAQSQRAPDGYVPLSALVDTRLEARQAKQRAEELQRRIDELSQPKAEPVDPWVDFEGAIGQRSQTYIAPVMQQVQTLQSQIAQLQAERVFGEKFGDFMTFIKEAAERGDPEVKGLEVMMDHSPNPYETAKKWFESKTFDPEKEVERRVAERLAQMQPQQPAQPAPVMPSNIAGARNVGTRSGPAWSGPPKLEDIFKR